MTRQTSTEAFLKIKQSGLLSKRRWQVYEAVYFLGPMTSAEAFNAINRGSPIKSITQSRARFTELRDMGVFSEVGIKICSVTGHRAIEWDVTKNLPTMIKKTKKKKCEFCEGKGYK